MDIYGFQSITKDFILENWPLFTVDGQKVEPRYYEDANKDQADVVYELVDALSRSRVVVLEVAPGKGKSIVGLVASWFIVGDNGKVVINAGPYKVLQLQYLDMFIKKHRVGDWKNSIIWGRDNYICQIAKAKCSQAPCLKAKRLSEALKICKYYTPVVRESTLEYIKRTCSGEKIEIVAEWDTIDGDRVFLISRDDKICPYYKQFMHYVDSNVIVLNSAMWLMDTLKGRRIQADIDIIDEFDFVVRSYHPSATLDHEILSIIKSVVEESLDAELKRFLKSMVKEIQSILKSYTKSKRLDYVRDLHDLLRKTFDYLFSLLDILNLDSITVRKLQKLAWFIKHHEQSGDIKVYCDPVKRVLHFVSLNPRNYFRWLFRNSKKILLMSATPIPKHVLTKVYGFDDDLRWVKASSKCYGCVYMGGFGDMYVSGKLLKSGKKDYIERYTRQFVRIILTRRVDGFDPGFIYAHSKDHIFFLKMTNISITVDEDGTKLREFIEGKIPEVITTRVGRGVDLPGDKCRSIVISKAPFPDRESPIWRAYENILNKDEYDKAYRTEAKNNLLQVIARALREPNDWVWVYSPDKHVEELLKELAIEGKITIVYSTPPITRELFEKHIIPEVDKKGYSIIYVKEFEGKCKWYKTAEELKKKIKYIAETYLGMKVDEYDVCKDILIIRPSNIIIDYKSKEIEEEIKNKYSWALSECIEKEISEEQEKKVEEEEEKVTEEEKVETEVEHVKKKICKVIFLRNYEDHKIGDEVEISHEIAKQLHAKGIAQIIECFEE